MIYGVQIRMARAALNWSVRELAEKSGVSTSTIKRMESEDQVTLRTSVNIRAVKTTFEAAGIEFIGAPDDRPGIRLNRPGG
jgi:transcriptional regulator with XRE-family HTH domain